MLTSFSLNCLVSSGHALFHMIDNGDGQVRVQDSVVRVYKDQLSLCRAMRRKGCAATVKIRGPTKYLGFAGCLRAEAS